MFGFNPLDAVTEGAKQFQSSVVSLIDNNLATSFPPAPPPPNALADVSVIQKQGTQIAANRTALAKLNIPFDVDNVRVTNRGSSKDNFKRTYARA